MDLGFLLASRIWRAASVLRRADSEAVERDVALLESLSKGEPTAIDDLNDGLLLAFSAWMWLTLSAGGLIALTLFVEQRFQLTALASRGSFGLFLFGAGMMLLNMLHGKLVDIFYRRLVDMKQRELDQDGRSAILLRLATSTRYEFWTVLAIVLVALILDLR